MFLKYQFLVRDDVLIFWGIPQGVSANSEYSQKLCWTMSTTVAFVSICHTSCLPKFGHQTLNCPSIRYIFPAKISPALLLCQKNWLCCKVCLDDFYPLLRSIASSWIHIGVKRISPKLAVYTTWKIWKKNSKTQLWDEKQNRALFLGHPLWYFD